VGIIGAGRPPPGLPGGIGGAPPPGLFGIAGAGLPELGGGGGTLEPPEGPIDPIDPIEPIPAGAAFLGPPGLGGDRRGLSKPLASQSFFTGGGTGVETVAIDTSPMMRSASLQA